MCGVKLSCVLALIQKYQAINKKEIGLTNGGHRYIKYPFFIDERKVSPKLPARTYAQRCDFQTKDTLGR